MSYCLIYTFTTGSTKQSVQSRFFSCTSKKKKKIIIKWIINASRISAPRSSRFPQNKSAKRVCSSTDFTSLPFSHPVENRQNNNNNNNNNIPCSLVGRRNRRRRTRNSRQRSSSLLWSSISIIHRDLRTTQTIIRDRTRQLSLFAAGTHIILLSLHILLSLSSSRRLSRRIVRHRRRSVHIIVIIVVVIRAPGVYTVASPLISILYYIGLICSASRTDERGL